MALDRPAAAGELGVLKVSAISWGHFDPRQNKALPPGDQPNGSPRVSAGDLLISRANTTELVGATVLVDGDHPNLLLSDKTLRLVPNAELAQPSYLLYALRTSWARRHIQQCATGTSFSMRNISQEKIGATPIPLPPLGDQRRIAEILDKADALRTKRRTALVQVDSLSKATFLNMFGNPMSSPVRWPTAALQELARTSTGGTPNRDDASCFGGDIPWVKSGELRQDVVMRTEEFLTKRGLETCAAKLMSPGTVLLALYGATAGAVARLGTTAATNQAICCIQPGEALDESYLLYLLRTLAPSLLMKRVGGAQPNLSQELIRTLKLPVPPRALQEQFAIRLRTIEVLKDRHYHSMRKLDALFASLQHRAFHDEL